MSQNEILMHYNISFKKKDMIKELRNKIPQAIWSHFQDSNCQERSSLHRHSQWLAARVWEEGKMGVAKNDTKLLLVW